MAGSFDHVTRFRNGKFELLDYDEQLCDHMGDGYEAIEECFDMIEHLAGGDLRKIYEAQIAHRKKRECTPESQAETFEHWLADYEKQEKEYEEMDEDDDEED